MEWDQCPEILNLSNLVAYICSTGNSEKRHSITWINRLNEYNNSIICIMYCCENNAIRKSMVVVVAPIIY